MALYSIRFCIAGIESTKGYKSRKQAARGWQVLERNSQVECMTLHREAEILREFQRNGD